MIMIARVRLIVQCALFFVAISATHAADEIVVVEPPPAEGAPGQFTFASVVRRAGERVSEDYAPDRPPLPPYLTDLDYDAYRAIRFKRDKGIWFGEGLPFQMQLLPRGFLYQDRVKINIIEDGQVKPLAFDQALFDYGGQPPPTDLPPDLGFAGFRLLYPINEDTIFDEVVAFLGASYFRAIAKDLAYGVTVRGLAIDTGLTSGEEFPVFTEFWVRKPTSEAVEVTVYGLLESRSLAGAYSFVIRPGIETIVSVKSHLFIRKPVKKLGIAPLTSMFFHGENTTRFVDDFRPEVHDSDGLLLESKNGERIWRPLVNPISLRVSRFELDSPKGFGLFQRDRDLNNYQDLEAHYHRRPSVIVEPADEWGPGVVELVEIPTNAERYDNIVAYWVPHAEITAGRQIDFTYRLRFAGDLESGMTGGRVASTRIGAGGTDGLDTTRRRFVIDFTGEALASLGSQTPLEAVVTASSGELSTPVTQPYPAIEGWRVFFELKPDGKKPSDLRVFLRLGEDTLSETWSFRWEPD